MRLETKEEILKYTGETADGTCMVASNWVDTHSKAEKIVEHIRTMFEVVLWDTELDDGEFRVITYFKERAE